MFYIFSNVFIFRHTGFSTRKSFLKPNGDTCSTVFPKTTYKTSSDWDLVLVSDTRKTFCVWKLFPSLLLDAGWVSLVPPMTWLTLRHSAFLAAFRCSLVLETILQNTCQLNAPLVTHMLVQHFCNRFTHTFCRSLKWQAVKFPSSWLTTALPQRITSHSRQFCVVCGHRERMARRGTHTNIETYTQWCHINYCNRLERRAWQLFWTCYRPLVLSK